MSIKSAPLAESTAFNPPSTARPKSSWLKRVIRVVLVPVLVLGLLLISCVVALPYALPWFIQQQGIDFHWEKPQWHLNGLSVSKVWIMLPDDGASPKQVQLDNLRINWAWNRFPIQTIEADHLRILWPTTVDQPQNDQTTLTFPAAFSRWLPQKIKIQEIDAKLPGLGHLQGSLILQASETGQLWQPAMIQSQLTLKNMQGSFLDSIPSQFRPQQLRVKISTHPDYQAGTSDQQLLVIEMLSEEPQRIQLTGILDLQQLPDWQATLKEGELLVQLKTLEYPFLQANQLQAHAYFTAHANSDRFTVSLDEDSNLSASQLHFPDIGQIKKATLELAGLSVQGRSHTPYDIEIRGPINVHLEDLSVKQLHQQNWNFTGALSGQLPQLELTGSLTGEHGLGFDGQIQLIDDSIQGRIALKDILLNANNPFEATIKAWPEQLSLNSGFLRSQIDFSLPPTGPFKLAVSASANKLSGLIDKGQLESLDLGFSAELELNPTDDWQGVIKEGQLSVQLDTFAHPSLHAEALKASILFTGHTSAERFTLSVNQPPTLEAHSLSFPNRGQAEKITLQLSTVSVQGRNKAPYEITADGTFKSHIKQLSAQQLHPQNWDIDGIFSGQLPQLELTGNLSNEYGLSFDSQIHLLKDSVEGNATVKEIFFKAGNPLQKTFTGWPELLSFTDGKLQSKIKFNLPKTGPFKLAFNGSASGLNGIINRSELSNITTQFSAQVSGQSIRVSMPTLTIGQFNPGIPLSSFKLINAHYNANLKMPLKGTANWQRIQANLLNGKAWLDAQQLNFKHAQKLLLNVEGLELQELFKVYPAEGLAGTGIMDGQLPVYIEGDTVYITDGKLQARQPGTLQFHSDKIKALAEKNPSMQVVADALEDFHFNLLHSALSYDQSGKLLLNIRLEGRNPDVEKGRPIHLNINLEENIPALLTSIQLSGKVSEIIQKRIRERLEKR